MITINAAQVELIVGLLTIIGVVFGVVFWIQKPQTALEKRVQKLEDCDREQAAQIAALKGDHDKNNELMQKKMEDLTTAINGLNITVAKLETIINERIPKGSPTLTPAGT